MNDKNTIIFLQEFRKFFLNACKDIEKQGLIPDKKEVASYVDREIIRLSQQPTVNMVEDIADRRAEMDDDSDLEDINKSNEPQ